MLLRSAGSFRQTRGMIVDELVALLRGASADFADARTGRNTTYRVSDAAAAFSVFFTRSASFPAWQRTLAQKRGGDNARTLFGVGKLPSDHQIRNLLDPAGGRAGAGLAAVFSLPWTAASTFVQRRSAARAACGALPPKRASSTLSTRSSARRWSAPRARPCWCPKATPQNPSCDRADCPVF